MLKEPKIYWQLFSSTFTLSAFTFGGGYVIVPLMRTKFVDKLHWLEEDEMLDIAALAQTAPGVIAVNASVLVGYRIAGILGALVAVLGTVLPPLIIITLISIFYEAFSSSKIVSTTLKGMQAAVAAVVVNVVISTGKNAVKTQGKQVIILMFAVFIAAYILKMNIALIMIICGLYGALFPLIKSTFIGNRGAK